MSEMLTVGPLTAVDGPLPKPRDYTLVQTAEIVPAEDERWGNSANVWPYPVDEPIPWGPCVEGSETKPGFTEQPSPVFQAFAVVMPIFCDLASIGYDEFRRRVLAALTARESHGVERAVMSGQGIPLSNYMADAAAARPLGNTAATPDHAAAVLEDYIAQHGGSGMLHATPALATALAARNVVTGTTGNGARLRTVGNQTPVVVGSGYVGVDPEGGDAATEFQQAWLWATDPMQIRRTEPYLPGRDMAEVLDRQTNDVAIYAERNYLVTWDTFIQAAVKVDLTP